MARLSRLPAPVPSDPDFALHAVLKEALESGRGLRACRQHLWEVSHFSGWQLAFPQVARGQPIGTVGERAQALERWRSIPRYLEQQRANLRVGLDAGYSTPKPAVKRLIGQLDAFAALPPERSPFASPGARATEAAFKAEWAILVRDVLTPAVRVHRDFLAREYLPRARTSLAVTALPDGLRCYRAMLRAYTTLDRTPEETYALGERTVATNATQAAAVGRKVFGTDDLATVISGYKGRLRRANVRANSPT